jgi:hypothetical protein
MKHGDGASLILLFSGFITLVLSGAAILPCLLQRLFAGAMYKLGGRWSNLVTIGVVRNALWLMGRDVSDSYASYIVHFFYDDRHE